MSDSLFNQVISILSRATCDKPWMTASSIARETGDRFDGEQIKKMLLAHYREAEDSGVNPKARYSSLPSRRTLEVLWGDFEKVGSRRLENITKDHVADDSLAEFEYLDLNQADVFVSHSHRDYTAVMAVAKYLLQNEIVPWLAETHIGQDDDIHEGIINALNSSQDFLLYLSPNALDSRWTVKEYGYALEREIPIFIVADISFSEIRKLLEAMRDKTHFDTAEKFKSASSESINCLIDDSNRIIETFAYSHASGIETQFPPARPLSKLPNRIRTRRSSSS